jgi:hypothetical protein
MSTLTVKELAAPTGFDLKIASGETLDLKSQGTVTMPTGSVLQVVQTEYSTQTNFSTGTYADTSLSASITPSSTASKILVVVAANGCMKSDGNTGTAMKIRLVRDSTEIAVFGLETGINWINQNGTWGTTGTTKLDSPSTTSSVTYKTQCASHVNGQYVRLQHGGSTSSITLMEIAG